MQVENISKHDFRKIKQYVPDNGISNMECKLYILDCKDKWNKNYKLFKKLRNIKGSYFTNKKYIITKLIEMKDIINIAELVMPIELMSINNEICGYTMPYIENICVSRIMRANIENKEKIQCLKEIGLLIEQIANKELIYPSDIHEGNFILNKETNKINMVDMDSVYMNGYKPSISKYLTDNQHLYNFHKYPMDNHDLHIPNRNTMYLSYIYMILNFISGCGYISELSLSKYYRYLNKISDLGISKELVDIFSKIYTESDNVNPVDLLETIPDNIEKFNHRGII